MAVEAERFGGLQVDHELELSRLKHRQVRRPFASENASGINADLAKSVERVDPIANQAASGHIFAEMIHRGYHIARRQRDEPLPTRVEKWIGGY